METSKKTGRNSSLSKHLRNTKGKWTKRMAHSKSRLTSKILVMESNQEEILVIDSVMNNGMFAFDNDKRKFFHWLNSPIASMQNQKPITLLDTPGGVELVNNELLRIEHSIY